MMQLGSVKRLSIILACIALCGLVLAGCGKKGGGSGSGSDGDPASQSDVSIVGTWTEAYFDSGYTFNADMTGMDTFWNLPFTYTAQKGAIVLTYDDDLWGTSTYNYTVNGDSLTMTRIDEPDTESTTFTYTRAGSSSAQTPAAGTDTGNQDPAADETTDPANEDGQN